VYRTLKHRSTEYRRVPERTGVCLRYQNSARGASRRGKAHLVSEIWRRLQIRASCCSHSCRIKL
jgi:hypothetical protein